MFGLIKQDDKSKVKDKDTKNSTNAHHDSSYDDGDHSGSNRKLKSQKTTGSKSKFKNGGQDQQISTMNPRDKDYDLLKAYVPAMAKVSPEIKLTARSHMKQNHHRQGSISGYDYKEMITQNQRSSKLQQKERRNTIKQQLDTIEEAMELKGYLHKNHSSRKHQDHQDDINQLLGMGAGDSNGMTDTLKDILAAKLLMERSSHNQKDGKERLRIDTDSVLGNQNFNNNISKALGKLLTNSKENKMLENSMLDSPRMAFSDPPSLNFQPMRVQKFDQIRLDEEAKIEKLQNQLLGHHNLLYGNLITLNMDNMTEGKDECYKLISKTSVSISISKIHQHEQEIDSRCLFRIIPQSQYVSQDNMRKIIESDVFPQKSIQREYDTLMAEADANKIYQQQLMGTDVKYWSDIQIIHEDTKRFLAVDYLDSKEITKYYNSDNFLDTNIKNITFQYQTDKYSHFKLIPACNFQLKGSGIISSGHYFYIIYTDSANKDFYLYNHEESGQFIFTESYKTPFRFHTGRQSKSLNEERSLLNTNIVVLTMANENFYINLKKQEAFEDEDITESIDNELNLIRKRSTASIKKKATTQKLTLQLIEYDDLRNIDLYGYWIVEPQDNLKIRLKNLMTGNYISLNKDELALTSQQSLNSTFEIVPISNRIQNSNFIDRHLVFKLRTHSIFMTEAEPLYLQSSQVKAISQPGEEIQNTIQNLVVDENSGSTKYLKLGKHIKLNKDDTFMFIFPDEVEILEISFCADSIQILKNILNQIMESQRKDFEVFIPNQENMKVLLTTQILVGLQRYCTNRLEGKILPKQKMGAPVGYRQKILKRAGLLEFLFDYLFLIQELKFQDTTDPSAKTEFEIQVQEFFKFQPNTEETQLYGGLLEIVFDLIYNIVFKYKAAKTYALERVNILQKFMFIQNAPRSLILILHEASNHLSKNEIHSSIDPLKIYQFTKYQELLNFFVDGIEPKRRKARYLYLIKRICIQDDSPLPIVQEYIYKQFFENPVNHKKLLQLQVNDESFNVYDPENETTYSLTELDIMNIDNPEIYRIQEFFFEQLELISDLCAGRNISIQGRLNDKLKFKYLLAAVRNIDLTNKSKYFCVLFFSVKAAFLRIITNLYINSEPNQAVQFNRIISFIEDQTKSQKFTQIFNIKINEHLSDLFSYLNDYFDQFDIINQAEIGQLEYEILNLCCYLLRYDLITLKQKDENKNLNIFKLVEYIFKLFQKFGEQGQQQNIISDTEKFLTLSLSQNGIIDEASLFSEKNLNLNNPVDRSALDLKYQLLNKKQWKKVITDETQSFQVDDPDEKQDTQERIRELKYTKKSIKTRNDIQQKMIEIFHLFSDLRHQYYLTNFKEFFKQEGIAKLKQPGAKTEEVLQNLQDQLEYLIPSNLDAEHTYVKKLGKFESIQILYEKFLKKQRADKEDAQFRLTIDFKNLADKIRYQIDTELNSATTLLDLMIELFNNCQEDSFLQQMSLSFISRCNSENAEFLRNIGKSLMIQEKSQLDMSIAVDSQLKKLTKKLQKSNLWALRSSLISSDEYAGLINMLKKFKKLFYYSNSIRIENNHDFSVGENKGRRKIQKYNQDLFRSLKGYDILLNYIQQNKKIFKDIQIYLNHKQSSRQQLKKPSDLFLNKEYSALEQSILKVDESFEQSDKYTNISIESVQANNFPKIIEVFRKCFQILEGFTDQNKKNQRTISNIGELDFLKAILQDNDRIKFSRSLDSFVQKINQRLDNQSKNSAIILQIYSNLIKYHDLPNVKKAVFFALEKSPQLTKLNNKQDLITFETGMGVLQILAQILQDDDTGKSKEILKKQFALSQFIDYKNQTLRMIDHYVDITKSSFESGVEKYFNFEKGEKFKDILLTNLSIIYSQIFLEGKKHTDQEIYEISKFAKTSFERDVQEYYKQIINNSLPTPYSKAELKYFLVHIQQLFLTPLRKISDETKVMREQFNFNQRRLSLNKNSNIISSKDTLDTLTSLIEKGRAKLIEAAKSQKELNHILKFLNQIQVGIDTTDYVQKDEQSIHDPDKFSDTIKPIEYTSTSLLQDNNNNNNNNILAQLGGHFKKKTNDKYIKFINEIWSKLTSGFIKNQSFRKFVRKEVDHIAQRIFKKLLKQSELKHVSQVRELKFIYNLIQHFEKCEKMPWTIYNFIFGLNTLRTIQKMSMNLDENKSEEIFEAKQFITEIFDSELNFNMIINIFNEANDFFSKGFFNDLIIQHIIHYLYPINPESQQRRFLNFFNSNKSSENFFKFMNQSIILSIEKINKKFILEKFQSRQSYSSLSNKLYVHKRYMEQDLIRYLKLICMNPNEDIKKILRQQTMNNRSYNIILMIFKFLICIKPHLHIQIIYDLVVNCLEFLNDVVQGPNLQNQSVLIDNGIFGFVKSILELEYSFEDYREDVFSKSDKKLRDSQIAGTTMLPGTNSIFELNNFQKSKLKHLVLNLMYNMLQGHPPDSDIFLQLRREFSPNTFRKIFSEFAFFFKNYQDQDFNMKLLFKYESKQSYSNPNRYITEIGFLMFFILKQIQESMTIEKDDFYYRNIVSLVPQEKRYQKAQLVALQKLFVFIAGFFQFVWYLANLVMSQGKKLIRRQNIQIGEFQDDQGIRETLQFLDQNSDKLEILKQNNQLQKVYFIKLPYCYFQTEDAKNQFLQSVNRDNTKSKVQGLMNTHRYFIRYLKQDYSVQRQPIIGGLAKHLETWELSSQIFSFLVNFLIIFSYRDDVETIGDVNEGEKQLFGQISKDSTSKLLSAAGYIVLINTSFILILQIFCKIPIYIDFAFRPENYSQIGSDSDMIQIGRPSFKQKVVLYSKKLWFTIKLIGSDFLLVYHMMCLLFAILGVTVHLFFFTFHLSYVIISSPTLLNVLRSIWEPKYKILLSLLLFLFLEYAFAIIAYISFKDDFPAENCDNLIRCFLVIVDQSLKAGGSLGGFLKPAYAWTDDSDIDKNYFYVQRIIYDNVFNFLLIILIIQMISGIIIDKFGALRERDENIERDCNSICFICGRSKETIDKLYDSYNGFYKHIYFDHNMWDYIYYSAFLYEKQERMPDELNDLEKYVIKKLENYDHSWLPAYNNYEGM